MLKSGTYVRERDGALLLYHSPITTYNFPHIALEDYLAGRFQSSLNQWRQVTDKAEILALRTWLCDHLKPGEYCTVTSLDVM